MAFAEKYAELRRQGIPPALAKHLAKIDMDVDGGDVEGEDT